MPLPSSINHLPSRPADVKIKALSGPSSNDNVHTWAEIAALPRILNDMNAPGPTIHPARSLCTSQSQEVNKSMMAPISCVKPVIVEIEKDEQRVVFVRGCKKSIRLSDITVSITEGPVISISIIKDDMYSEVSA